MSQRAFRVLAPQVIRHVSRALAGQTPLRSPAVLSKRTLPSTYTHITSARRWHSSPAQGHKQYDFSEIKELSSSRSEQRILVDVREPAEYEAGYIPGAINIPVKSQPDAIFLPAEEFEDRFGFSKPDPEKEIIFYCRAGVRSSAAAQLAEQQGYKNISEYRGSWLDWEKNGGPVATP